MQSFIHNGQELKYKTLGDPECDVVVIWGHGWGHNHAHLEPIARPLENIGFHCVLDFPGFGQSPVPHDAWGPEDYAAFIVEFIKSFSGKHIIWVGHSFGCRVGVHIASTHRDLFSSMCLIAAAGLPRKRSLHKAIYFKARIALYKFMKKITKFGLSENWLKSKFGSSDYRNAGVLRDILVKTVNENLTQDAKLIKCPTTLVFGAQDDQTPPEMGERYHKLIPGSEFIQLEGYDHYSILTEGQHQLARTIKNIIENVKTS
ncbi:alpha/beta hydrolase [Alphaproteobacteria bacterium]|nr:alpha/beta hydrolase [Alphaproteobacteria bacterium]